MLSVLEGPRLRLPQLGEGSARNFSEFFLNQVEGWVSGTRAVSNKKSRAIQPIEIIT